MPYFTYEKVVFNYQSIGEGYPLLVLHGLGGDLSQGLGLLHGLKGYKLLSMDFKSHGDTQYESEANEYNFASFAQDALAFVKHMGYKQILLGGISMGAGVSLRLAVDNPGLVKGLILIRPAWLNQSSPINLHIMLSIADCIKKAGLDKGKQLFENTSLYKEMNDACPACTSSLLQLFTRKKAYTNAALFRSMVQDKPLKEWNQINQISCPTLVLSCEGDPVHPYKMGVELASYIQGANHEKVASRYTHNLQYQKDCFTAITKFVTSLTL